MTWQGLDVLIADLDTAPSSVVLAAHDALYNAAERTEREMLSNYPQGETGHLRAGLSIDEIKTTSVHLSIAVKSSAPHAHLWEQGTAEREMPSGKDVGRVVPHLSQSLVVVAERHRREMELEIIAAVQAAGFTVEGDF